MEEEILNIEYHQKRLVIKALNRTGTLAHAAPLLGITTRTLRRLMDAWGIQRVREKSQTIFKIQTKTSPFKMQSSCEKSF